MLTPSFMGDAADGERMRALLKKYEHNPEKSFLCRCLKEEIYQIEIVRAMKAFY